MGRELRSNREYAAMAGKPYWWFMIGIGWMYVLEWIGFPEMVEMDCKCCEGHENHEDWIHHYDHNVWPRFKKWIKL